MSNIELFNNRFEEDEFESKSEANGFVYWFASDLMKLVGYDSMNTFSKAINKTYTTLNTLNINIADNIIQINRDVEGRSQIDYKLSRVACYLVVLNADNKKPKVAAAQLYFANLAGAMQDYLSHAEGVERVVVRDEISEREKSLTGVAHSAGVVNYAFFQNAGYRGMYNMNLRQIRAMRGIPDNKSPLDYMGKDELAANLFRVTQTELKIKNDNIQGQNALEATAENVGREVRSSMIKISGVKPEHMQKHKDVKEVKKELKNTSKEIKKIDKNK